MYTCPPQKYRVILAHTGRPDLHQYFEGRLRAEFDISSFDHGPSPTLLLEWCDTITLVPDDELDAISGILLGGGAGQQSLS